jgi:hypothetical protein
MHPWYARRGVTEPNRLTFLVYVGAVSSTVAVVDTWVACSTLESGRAATEIGRRPDSASRKAPRDWGRTTIKREDPIR